jgi:hypothetical protein
MLSVISNRLMGWGLHPRSALVFDWRTMCLDTDVQLKLMHRTPLHAQLLMLPGYLIQKYKKGVFILLLFHTSAQ